MSVVTWPSTLPFRLMYGFDYIPQQEGDVLVSDFEIGMPRQRNMFTTTTPSIDNMSMWYSDAEKEQFLRFWRDTLKNGARTFEIVLPTGVAGQVARCMFDAKSLRINAQTFDRHLVTARLFIRQIYTIDEGTYYFLNEYGADTFEIAYDSLHQAVNVVLPNLDGAL